MSHAPSRRPDDARHSRSTSEPDPPPTDATRHAPDPLHDAAVADVRAVLAAGWPRWVREHHMDPAPELTCADPTVTLVGERPETYHQVAVLRFTFSHAGTRYRGFARGPLESPSFVVSRVVDPETPLGAHRWWRRRG